MEDERTEDVEMFFPNEAGQIKLQQIEKMG
jgi:hypothetical protein